jgi:NOL1/NOP2/fmu family ribosome biogenesis protein
MLQLKILNSREVKEVMKKIEDQWGCRMKLDYGFLQNTKKRIFIVNRQISEVDISKLKVNNIGMYFCEDDGVGIRLSIEGSQIIGPHATKNLLEVSDIEAKSWFKGEDLLCDNDGLSGFVILKNKNDFLGSGKFSKGKILNFVSKTRRISAL